MRLFLYLSLFILASCGSKQNKTASDTASTPPTTPAKDSLPVVAKTLQTYVTEYQKAHVEAGDSIVVKQQERDYVRFEHFPLTGEIIGVTTVQLGLIKTEGQPDRILVFTYGCVEGSCNLDLDNLKCYTADWKEDNSVLPLAEIRSKVEKELINAQKNKATRVYNHFIVHIREQSFDLQLVKSTTLENGTDVGDIQGKAIQTYYWNTQTQQFTKEYPYAG